MRQTHSLFRHLIVSCWANHESHVLRSPNFTNDFHKKIQHLQTYLSDWNVHVFGQVGQNKKRIRVRLLGTQRALSVRPSPFLLIKTRASINHSIQLHSLSGTPSLANEVSYFMVVLWGRQHTVLSRSN